MQPPVKLVQITMFVYRIVRQASLLQAAHINHISAHISLCPPFDALLACVPKSTPNIVDVLTTNSLICAEHSSGWWKISSATAVLRFTLAVQRQINTSWDGEVNQPAWQPWRRIEHLLLVQQAMPRADKILLLQLVLATPPPCQVGRPAAKDDVHQRALISFSHQSHS